MEENEQKDEMTNDFLNAAGALQGAVKVGGSLAKSSLGSALGGPQAAALVTLWKNRRLVAKIVILISALLMIPLLFVMLLPSLIFGNLDLTSENTKPILNNNPAIMEYIESIDTRIREILTNRHDDVLEEIAKEIQYLADAPNTTWGITDEYAEYIPFDNLLFISEYTASKNNYKEISADDMIEKVQAQYKEYFFYEVEITTYTSGYGEDKETFTHYEFIVRYIGDGFFKEKVFELSEEQTVLALDYNNCLKTFLEYAGGDYIALGELLAKYPFLREPGVFVSPFLAAGEDWESHVTSEFGKRLDPFTGKPSGDSGMDIGFPIGTPINAAMSGTVTRAKYQNTGYGYHIIIDHGNGMSTLYGHCSELLVSEGQQVTAGQMIAKVGTTGRSTGPHLHFEVRIDGVAQNPRGFLEAARG